ncbi:MAG: isoaspartyl peptidase/L-asparaginase [Planctomycetota bacterium]
MSTLSASAQDSPRWAIVIHGGAGDPTNWDDAKRETRLKGLDRALRAGADMLAKGATALDTVETVVGILEDDPAFNAGRGAVVTNEGNAELDASIMDGKTRSCGAIAGVTTVKNPIQLARKVMTETKHVLLAGDGAEEFAVDQGVERVDPDYFLSSTHVGANPDGLYLGTVGCVVLDQNGDLAAGTSTGGTPKKLPGRIGDSPIIGAGTYAANDTCAVSGTGVGEEYIRHSVAFDIAAQMRYAGRSIDEAVTNVMTKTLRPNVGGLIAVSRTGEIVMQHNTPGMSSGAADSNGRFETRLK